MNVNLPAVMGTYLDTLDENGIGLDARLSVWAVLSDLLRLADVPADDWPADVRAASLDTLAPAPVVETLR